MTRARTRTPWCPCERTFPDDPLFWFPGPNGRTESAQSDRAGDEEHRTGLPGCPGDSRDGPGPGNSALVVGEVLRAEKKAPAPSPPPRTRSPLILPSGSDRGGRGTPSRWPSAPEAPTPSRSPSPQSHPGRDRRSAPRKNRAEFQPAAVTAHVSQSITRKSASNLALAFVLLPRDKRDEMAALYAFCREVDDVADEESAPAEQRRARLAAWREDIRKACDQGAPSFPLIQELKPVIARYGLPFALFDELIRGVEMDLDIKRYETYAALELYCYRVASVVGRLSIEIFGYRDP